MAEPEGATAVNIGHAVISHLRLRHGRERTEPKADPTESIEKVARREPTDSKKPLFDRVTFNAAARVA